MDTNLLKIIIRHNFRMQLRNRVLQIFFFFILVVITYFHLRNQSNLSRYSTSGIFTLASFIPYMNAYMFSVLQIIPMIFVATSIFNRGRKIDSLDAMYYRPESNMEYIWGVSLGTISIFLFISTVSLFIAAVIHLFASDAPFCIWNYLFYFFTLIVPTTIFAFGFSLFIYRLVGNSALCIAILSIYFSITIFYIADSQQGVFDPTGITIPNVWSEITGHANLVEYLLQRGCWFFLGLGFIQFCVLNFERLSNSPELRKIRVWIASLLVVAGLISGVSFFMINHEKVKLRRIYMNTYNKYADVPKATMLRQDVKYEQDGRLMSVSSKLTIQNQTGKELKDVILYLNPALKVVMLQTNGNDILFDREHQVIRMHQSILSGDTLNIDIVYKGSIDANICYLDVPDNIVFDTRTRGFMACQFGKEYAFLEDVFTLLTPEVLWYPTTIPSVNPEFPFLLNKNYTYYTLQVANQDGKSVISQGKRERFGNHVNFVNEVPLSGISLCIGEYETKSVYVDSVYCELNIFRRKSSLFELLGEIDTSLLVHVKDRAESKMQARYPYEKFILIETPISFTSYYRNNHSGSEYIQPELVCLPERGTGKLDENELNTRDLLDNLRGVILGENGDNGNFSWREQFGDFDWNLSNYLSKFQFQNNPYCIYTMFQDSRPYFYSNQYPIINTVMNTIVNQVDDTGNSIFEINGKTGIDAMNYLNANSLEYLLCNKNISQMVMYEIMNQKSKEILSAFDYEQLSRDTIKSFILDFMNKHKFQSLDFTFFDSIFTYKYGMSWESKLSSWYTENGLPRYLIKDFSVRRIKTLNEVDSTSTLVQFTIFNDSNIDGIITLQSSERSYNGIFYFMEWGRIKEPLNKSFKIQAQTGRRVALLVHRSHRYFRLHTNYSSNIPYFLATECPDQEGIVNYQETFQVIDKNDFNDNSNETIVDNEDSSFSVVYSSLITKLTDYFQRDTGFSKYSNLTSFVFLNDRWSPLLENHAYGGSIKSVVLRLAGKGKSRVEWSAILEKQGRYEIYVYIPKLLYNKVLRTQEMQKVDIGNQEYKIYLRDTIHEININVRNQEGWYSLGIYECDAGESKVSLSDLGIPNQVIVADAVKWVYLGIE